ncbi:pyridoxamine 5'-phosphate oxidase family protein [Enterococcus wangshanyuanii]|uniref:Pyridoxamine 5'-phosphate oxidase n=1 Tax=Enterococcus wangshanyuanii TaxID=2005703 RepID=A0ABQ1NSZ4_9ENTE|nr:pyridoxamine 5'-phosphate oxidase family protein [Enterococcus wangshanyuanii]GGC84633.1 pyridoxamine 5'-phosphate oxidase [Enterococcus wangshanyuanii]
MRRKEFEVTEKDRFDEILAEAHVVRLAFFDQEFPYIVPVNFGYEWQEERLFLYVHGARQGKKLSLLKENPKIGFEMDCRHKLITADEASKYTYHYRSIIGQGVATILTDLERKRHALLKLMEHETKRMDFDIPDKQVLGTGLIQIEVKRFTAKERI